MPSGGLSIYGAGLQLQQVYPGVQNTGNANISGKFRAAGGATFPLNGDAKNNEVIGQAAAITGTFGSRNVILGAQTQVWADQPGGQIGGVCIGYGAILGANGNSSQACTAIGYFAHAGGQGNLGGGDVAIGYQANCAGWKDGNTWVNWSYSCVIGGNNARISDASNCCLLNAAGTVIGNRENVLVINDKNNQVQQTKYNGSNVIVIGCGTENTVKIGAYDFSSGFLAAQFVGRGSVTVANTVAKSSLLPGVAFRGSNQIGSNTLISGSVVQVKAWGTITDTGTPTLQMRIEVAGGTVLDFGAVALPALGGTQTWQLEAEFVVLGSGAPGTAQGQGIMTVGGVSVPFQTNQVAAWNVNTTLPITVDLTAQWGTAAPANSIVCSNVRINVQI